jgi:hypothetical protein
MTMKDFQAAVDKAVTETTESEAQAIGGGGEGEAIAGSQEGVQDAGRESNAASESLMDKTDLPPELEDTRKSLLKDYHAKMQAFAEKERQMQAETAAFKEDSQTLRQLAQTDWFRKALEAQRAERNGNGQASLDLTDEQFETIRNDKRAFAEFVSGLAEKVAEKKFGPKLNATQEKLGRFEEAKEIEQLSAKYPGFSELKASGALDVHLKQGSDYKTAYALAMLDNPQKSQSTKQADPQVEAERLLAAKKNGSVPNSGLGTRGKAPVVNVKKGNLDDLMDKLGDLARKGQDPMKFEVNRV